METTMLSSTAAFINIFVYVFYVANGELASVVFDVEANSFSVKDDVDIDFVAWANFKNEINVTGWSYLNVTTSEKYSDEKQAYAAGLVEGFLTAQLISLHWHNMMDDYCKDEEIYCERLIDFIDDNMKWMKKQIKEANGKNPFWHQVNLLLNQFRGLQDGFNQQVSKGLISPLRGMEAKIGLIAFQLFGDFEDLEVRFNKSSSLYVRGNTLFSCSAIVKILPNNEDIFVSQETWSSYESMLRILKLYHFYYHVTNDSDSNQVPSVHISFSSYPATLNSIDDFYLLSSGLVSMETTIGNLNRTLNEQIKAQSVLEWMRCMVANRLSKNGDEWTNYLIQYNSGTYNNQWMVINMNVYEKEKPLADGLLWIVEKIPNYYERADKTDVLRQQQYWPSYNVAYFPKIFNLSGAAEAVAIYGDWFSYDKTPRALIFKRDQSKVTDLHSLIRLMRSNDFTHDPLSLSSDCSPPYSGINAIAARCDLNPKNGSCRLHDLGLRAHGAIDLKVTSSFLFSNFSFLAIGGPTYDSVPPFQWSKSEFWNNTHHVGQPDLWKFDPIMFGSD